MSWITIIWSATSGACFMLALMHLLVWSLDRRSWASLCFAVVVFSVLALAIMEMVTMRTESPEVFGLTIRWTHLIYAFGVAGSLGFVHFYFGTGRNWLLVLAIGLRVLVQVPNFTTGLNLHIASIQSLQKITFLGEPVSILRDWVPNPWMRLGWVASLAQLCYVVDASVRLWRTGAPESRKRAGIVGGAFSFFIVFAVLNAALVLSGVLRMPLLTSFPFLGVLLVMGYELSRDVLRAAQLSYDLRESEARMTLAAEAAGFGVWIWTPATNRVWGSERWLRLFGFKPDTDVTYDQVFQRIHPDDRARVEAEVRHAVENGAGYAGEYRVMLSDGTARWVVALGRMHPDAHGKPARMLGAAVDITVRKQAEQDLAQQRNEVAHLARVTTLGEISGSLAHELGQPLGAILTNTDSIEMHLRSPAPNLDEVRTILADIRRDDLRASEILQGMREFLRRKKLDLQPLEVGRLAEEVVKLVSSDAAARKTTVGLEIPQGLPRVRGDRIHLQQVLLNLLVNGMDAMSTCPVADRRITIRAAQTDSHTVEIAVSDSGVGIPPGELDRLFTPFHTTKQSGLGLGLPICRSIVEAHGGSISLQNNPQRGTTARFTLPACPEAHT
jgi:PAS domain S-box-containing protein